jgi:Insertion element 4 transposase N-terminal
MREVWHPWVSPHSRILQPLVTRSHLRRFMRRHIDEHAPLTDAITLDALGAAVPHAVVKAVVAELGVAEPRRRTLPAEVALLFSVAMHLCTQDSRDHVWVTRLKGLRCIWPDPTVVPASQGAVCQARDRLGAQPPVALLHRVCQPIATAAPPRAFLCGLRLMASEGTTADVPDTPAHVDVCGRHPGARGARAVPQGPGVDRLACGTHAIAAGYPALELACASHERWEIELAIDELDLPATACSGTQGAASSRGESSRSSMGGWWPTTWCVG